jgi:hypothetical protein
MYAILLVVISTAFIVFLFFLGLFLFGNQLFGMILVIVFLLILLVSLLFLPLHFIAGAFEFITIPMWYFSKINKIKPFEGLGWSWSKQKMKLRAIQTGCVAGIFAVIMSLGFIRTIMIDSPEPINLPMMIILTLVIAIIIVLAGLFAGAVISLLEMFNVSELPHRTKPNQGIIVSVRNSFLVLLFSLLLAFILSRFVWNFWIFLILIFVILIGSETFAPVFQHLILRSLLTISRQAPLNLAKFLDYASERILLRKVGGGYVFLHRMLLEYFANLDEDADEKQELDKRVARLAENADSQDHFGDIDNMDTEFGAQL